MEKEKAAKTFSQRLKNLRKSANLSQDDLAAALGISKGALSYYENTQRVPDIVTLDRIAEHFKVSADYLLGRTEAKTGDFKMRAFCDYMELNEKHIEKVRKLCGKSSPARDAFIKMLDFVDYIVFKAR